MSWLDIPTPSLSPNCLRMFRRFSSCALGMPFTITLSLRLYCSRFSICLDSWVITSLAYFSCSLVLMLSSLKSLSSLVTSFSWAFVCSTPDLIDATLANSFWNCSVLMPPIFRGGSGNCRKSQKNLVYQNGVNDVECTAVFGRLRSNLV